ncbi:MAG TPA: tetratricopeptide repeat protein [Solirubrobacterales bacterium]|nr:tetratricopeptide repeat protein [Solirubrobacterales bacterium]
MFRRALESVGRTKLASWLRRGTILASTLGLAAAIGAVGVFLSARWLVGVGVFVALLGAVFRVAGELEAQDRQAAVDRQERDGRTRIPIAGIREVDPTQVGIDRAPPQEILAGGEIPTYLPRGVDGQLDAAIRGALDGTGRWAVIAVGKSKVGKSRALFEALRRQAAETDLELIAPVDYSALKAMLVPGEAPKVSSHGSILWLDDLEPFVDQGMTMQTLEQWHVRFAPCVVAATFGGKGNMLVKSSSGDTIGTISGEVRRHAQEVHLGVTSAAEISALPANISADALASIERHGLAAYLVAGPELATKLATRREPGEPECPEGSAVVHAAVDWAQAGRTDPISTATLEGIWGDYLPPGSHLTENGFETGLRWALKPVAGSIALLEEVDGYRAYDYVVELVKQRPEIHSHQDSVWGPALKDASDVQALAVGLAAFGQGRFEDSERAYRKATESSRPFLAALARVNLGIVLGEMGRIEEEEAIYDEVAAQFADAEDPALRGQAVAALFDKGVALGQRDELEASIGVYRDVGERFGDDRDPEIRRKVGMATVNMGVAHSRLGRHEEALAVFEELLERIDGVDPGLPEHVVIALFGKGNELADLDRSAEAAVAYQEVVDRFGDLDDEAVREHVSKALFNKALRLSDLGLLDDEIAAYREIMTRFSDAEAPMLRGQVVRAWASIAVVLAEQGRRDEAIHQAEELIARFGDSEEPEVQEPLARAFFNYGVDLSELDRHEEATAAYGEVVDRFADSEDRELRYVVAMALNNRSVSLNRLDRRDEAVAACEETVRRFGDANEPRLKEQVAMSFNNKAKAISTSAGAAGVRLVFEEMTALLGDSREPEVQKWVRSMEDALAGVDGDQKMGPGPGGALD